MRLGRLNGVVAGRGPTALFLHGGLLDHSIFHPQLAGLSGLRESAAVDLPGFGASAANPGPLSLGSLADAALEAAMELPPPWDLVGLSLGAAVAIEIARRRPDLVRSVSLISAVRAQRRGPADIALMKARLLQGGQAAMAEGFAARMVSPVADESVRAQIRDLAMATPQATVLALYDMMADYPSVLEPLLTLQAPVFLIAGEDDLEADHARLLTLQSKAPRRQVLIIPRCGHLATLEQPLTVNAALAAFWRDADQTPGAQA